MEGVNGDTAFYLENLDIPPIPSAPSKKLTNGTNGTADIPPYKTNGINGHTANGITA